MEYKVAVGEKRQGNLEGEKSTVKSGKRDLRNSGKILRPQELEIIEMDFHLRTIIWKIPGVSMSLSIALICSSSFGYGAPPRLIDDNCHSLP